jgi:hypothetical protein
MPYAVLHATTRVIRRLTVDAMHQIAADEILESVIPPITLAGGPWVLVAENGIVRAATPQEIDDADADSIAVQARRAAILAEYLAASDDLRDDVSVPANYRNFFRLHSKVMRGLTR